MFRKLVTIIIILTVSACVLWAGPRDNLWAQVDQAANKDGLPQTAIGILDEIIPAALADEAYAEAARAILRKIALEGQIQGNKAEEKIFRLHEEIALTPETLHPVMETVLAHWYWQYFQQNQWRFLQRTETAEPPSKDFTTWDLVRILGEIDKHFTEALSAEDVLKTIPITEYDDLLEKGNMPDAYRPTLYDFLAHEALSFYSAGEQGAMQPQDRFEIMADSPIFAPVADFLAWEPQTADETSVKVKAIKIYQELLLFHQADADPSAYIDTDLARLRLGYNLAVGPEKIESYKLALQHFVDQWPDHGIAARALAQWARVLYDEEDYVTAHALATRGLTNYPKTKGADECITIVQLIERPSASIQTERVWNAPWPDITVSYRNVTHVYFRVVNWDFEAYAKPTNNYLSSEFQRELLKAPVSLTWDSDLSPTGAYQLNDVDVPVPSNLRKGFYFIIASHDPAFSNDSTNQVSIVPVWVSDLSLVIRQHKYDGIVEGFVLDAESGAPLADVSVARWVENYDTRQFDPYDNAMTNQNGMFSFSYSEDLRYKNVMFVAQYGADRLTSETKPQYSSNSSYHSLLREQTVLFTDRSLYRPGQTIQYKGICIRFNTATDTYRTVAGHKVPVVFRDTNGQEIAQHTHVSNDYGSFSGHFTAPRDRLLGQMNLNGVYLNVEEYKRPTFHVELEAPAESPKLDAQVLVPGRATAYTGAAIGGAQVTWRVQRTVRFPYWCWWCRWSSPGGESQAIAHGTAVTAADGTFSLSFTATPDLSVSPENEPTFQFQIVADVTDSSGETRSQETQIRVGYTALQADLQVADWQTPDQPVLVDISTESLNGDPETAQGTVSIYTVQQPGQVIRPPLHAPVYSRYSGVVPPLDPANADTWDSADLVSTHAFVTNDLGYTELSVPLDVGIYRVLVETQDRFGQPVTARRTVQVIDPEAAHYTQPLANLFAAPTWSVQPGEVFTALWGTGYTSGRAFVEIECRNELLSAWWTDGSRTQVPIEQAVTEAMRGGFTVRVTYVRENRLYHNERIVAVPWLNKQMTVMWETFRSKLKPGQAESWTAIITGPDARGAVAEMVAGLYDASLDQYLPHQWLQTFNVFRSEFVRLTTSFENTPQTFRKTSESGWYTGRRSSVSYNYRSFPYDILSPFFYGYAMASGVTARSRGGAVPEAMATVADQASPPDAFADQVSKSAEEPEASSGPDLDQVAARTNLDETAFFFPHLVSDSQGRVRMEFTMPEALTQWRFMGFAHDNDLRSGFLTDTTVTAKDLMIQPNPPRFVREGDTIEFTVKVTNMSAARQYGQVRLTLADARTGQSRDQALGNLSPDQDFDVPSMESRSYAWRLTIPDGTDMLTYRAVGATDRLSDGEEAYLPVLSRRILVTESLPLPIRGAQTREFEFTKLLQSGQSDSLSHQSLTVQMVSQPAWYAVMALPYLMEYPHECSEQIFNRVYANALGQYIANGDPKIRRIFDQWKNTPALDSPLEKNEDLKALALEETPWVRQAISESQARRNVGILFDDNRLRDELSRALFKLTQRQNSNGLWSWFPGGHPSEYISLYITTGFARLRHLGVDGMDMSAAIKSLYALDAWMDARYRWILEHGDKDDNHLSSLIAFYLYGRSFFLTDQPVDPAHQEAFEYWKAQGQQYWLSQRRQSQAHLALALHRLNDRRIPQAIMASIREHSVTDEELGMFWRDTERSWWWYRAPIETQAMMIEAFDEVVGDAEAVEACRVWLLKQKQTQDWKTTKATADAVYGLLLRGTNMLASDALVEVALGGQWIEPEAIEAGTGFYEERFVRNEIVPAMGQITVKKVDDGVSWGSVHWQYLEDMRKITPYEGTPLQLKKSLYVKINTNQGQVLQPIGGGLSVGDELVVRIELRVDRDMEYLHMKDQRGSGTEPVNVLSRYKYQDGLGYYESTRDTATHFFISYLPKGVYVFEYSTRIQHKGQYQSGMASIQCMYAPEFNSHSESFDLNVK
jgi:uncharacterized protein YfaS (alpha-2-macroglobulin family)